MHIAEGFLPIEWAAFWYLASLPFLYFGARAVGKIFKERPEHKLTLAVSGAFIFVLSSMKLPSVTGSSSHPTGTGLAAILYGPTTAAVLAAIVLVFQALLLAHGGITTLGADIFSMGIAGPFVAYFVFKGLRLVRIPLGVSFFFAAALSDIATYVITSLQLALAYPGASFANSFSIFLGIFAITQIPLAIAEGVLLWMFFDYLQKSRPKIVAQCIGEAHAK
jgi:cobalt/nickel transport system permease protein